MKIGKVVGLIIGILLGFVLGFMLGFVLASYWNDPGVRQRREASTHSIAALRQR
jgi:hypothetical protein